MPYRWHHQGEQAQLRLWPHRALAPRGFVGFIGATAALFCLPLLATLGTPGLWMVLPFVAGTLALIWWALRRSGRDGAQTFEILQLSPDRVTLTRHDPGGRVQSWQANPYWVRLECHESAGPVPDYLTLQGNGRMVEIGAFLSPAERQALRGELARALARPGAAP